MICRISKELLLFTQLNAVEHLYICSVYKSFGKIHLCVLNFIVTFV